MDKHFYYTPFPTLLLLRHSALFFLCSPPLHFLSFLSCLISYPSLLHSHTHHSSSLPLHIQHHTTTRPSAPECLYHTPSLSCSCNGQQRRTVVTLSNLHQATVPSEHAMTNRRRTSNKRGIVGYNTHRLDRNTGTTLCMCILCVHNHAYGTVQQEYTTLNVHERLAHA